MAEEQLERFVWKGPKTGEAQTETRLIDCGFDDLRKYWRHCREMLENQNPRMPGRLVLVKKTEDQIWRCRAELLVRWLRSERNYTYQNCYEDIRTLISKNSDTLSPDAAGKLPISTLMVVPDEYKRVPVGLVLAASMYALGELDTSHITLNFLIKLGIYLTQREMQTELLERDPKTGKAKNRMELIKQREGLDPSVWLKCQPTGLTYAEFHQMCNLHKDKYENFTTAQLKILSDKVLYRFQLRCEEQAKQWQAKAHEIELVAQSKGWDVTRDDV